MDTPRRRFLRMLTGTAIMVSAGMAIAQGKSPASIPNEKAMRAALEKRVTSYWAARKGSDLGAAYAFYSPEFRGATARPDFLRNYQRLVRFPPEKFSVEAVEFHPGGRGATVKVRLELHRDIEGQKILLSSVADETWVFVDRNWWKKDEPLNINI